MPRARRHLAGISLGIILGLCGCDRITTGGRPLTVASSWPAADRRELESAFARWLASRPGEDRARIRIDWVPLDPGGDPSRVVGGHGPPLGTLRAAVDVVLGGPATAYARLEQGGHLVPVERPERPAWCVARRSPLGRAVKASGDAKGGGRAIPRISESTFDDPRHDPVTLAWAEGTLGEGEWASGYARLVREAGGPGRIGRQAGGALAAVERGEASSAPAVASHVSRRGGPLKFLRDVEGTGWIEGVAIVRGGGHPDLAQRFLEFLDGRGQAGLPPTIAPGAVEAEDLLADLLGATLVDAQDELWGAWETLRRAGHPERAEMWMTEPPPWPPASIGKLLERDRSGALIETLAAEIAPDPDIRAWLLRSWFAPMRRIDGVLLRELAEADGGRLMHEPRFRAWLRAEWTAWARQRYRRVAKLAREALP